MSVDVYLMDQRWVFQYRYDPINRKFSSNAPNPTLQVPNGAVQVMVGPTDDMQQVVQNVRIAVGGQKIGILNIGGHGDAGVVKLGRGLRFDNAGAFADLHDSFDTYKRVIKIFGCGVASDTDLVSSDAACQGFAKACGVAMVGTWSPTNAGKGYQLMKALANVTGASVQASVHVGSDFVPWFFNFTTRTILVYPDDRDTAAKYLQNGGVLSTSRLIKHGDYVELTYDGKGNLISQR
jgi:hypothetical protein